MVHDPARTADLARLRGLEFGEPMEPAMPPRRPEQQTWSSADVERYFVWKSTALYIPTTTKHDLAKYADLLAGLATKLKHLASRNCSDMEALIEARMEIDATKRKLKLAGRMPTKAQQKRMEEQAREIQKNTSTIQDLTHYRVENDK